MDDASDNEFNVNIQLIKFYMKKKDLLFKKINEKLLTMSIKNKEDLTTILKDLTEKLKKVL